MVKNSPAIQETRVQSLGEGNGYPHQYSCWENSTDRGTWWATGSWVAESDRTKQLTQCSQIPTNTFPWNHHEMRLLQMQVHITQTSQISEHHNNLDVIFQMNKQILEKFWTKYNILSTYPIVTFWGNSLHIKILLPTLPKLHFVFKCGTAKL